MREGITWLERAAAQRDSRATVALGKLWLVGASGVGPDPAKARGWFMQVDAARFPQATYYLGLIDKTGSGQPPNHTRAATHFRFAAKRGIPEAMYPLGNAYASGEGVDSDPREAMRWYLRAASLEHPLAYTRISPRLCTR